MKVTKNQYPSILRLFAVAMVCLTLIGAFFAGLFPIRNGDDPWRHLKTGEFLWNWFSQHGFTFPEFDVFTSAGAGTPWINHEWLSQILFYGAYRMGGLQGVIVFKSLILTVTIGLLIAYMYRNGVGWKTACLGSLIALLASQGSIALRPAIFTYLFIVIFLHIILSLQLDEYFKTAFVGAIFAEILWVNLHGGAIIGILLIFFWWLSELWFCLVTWLKENPTAPSFRRLGTGSIVLGAVFLASFINPFTYQIHWLSSTVMNDWWLLRNLGDLQPPNMHYTNAFECIILGIFILPMMRAGSIWIYEGLAIVFFGHLALNFEYFIPLFALVATPPLMAALSEERNAMIPFKLDRGIQPGFWGTLCHWVKMGLKFHLDIMVVFLVVAYVFGMRPGKIWHLNYQDFSYFRYSGYKSNMIPEEAADFLAEQFSGRSISGSMFCGPTLNRHRYDDFSGYLTWRFSPETLKLFTDGRYELWGSQYVKEEKGVFDARTIPLGAYNAKGHWLEFRGEREREDILPWIIEGAYPELERWYASKKPYWEYVLDKYEADLIFTYEGCPIDRLLRQEFRGWFSIYEKKGEYVIYLRDTPGNMEIIRESALIHRDRIPAVDSPETQPDNGRTKEVSTEILWDTWGIPHIFARNNEELFYAFGYAQMRSHADLILRLYGRARGRAAEYWGEDYLNSDKWIRITGVPSRAQDWYKAQKPEFKRCLDAFAAGINAYAAGHLDQIDDSVEIVLPIEPTDILAHIQQAIHFTFVTNANIISNVARSKNMEPAGSNTWAISQRLSASGHAMLLANPHLPWSDLFTWYESHLISPDINAYGAALVGTPFLGIAFNEYLGWSHTVNTHDGADLYGLVLVGNGYRWDGGTRPLVNKEHLLKVKQKDGTFREETFTVRSSIHGPIIAMKDRHAIALRIVGLDRPHLTEQYWAMARAQNLDQFQTALKMMQMPMFTVMYADRDGRIMHLFGGLTPVRTIGDWNWDDVAPGSTSETLWTKYHSYTELPRAIDPQSGWLQNANDPPWTTTFPLVLNPTDFPSYMAPRGMSLRAQRSAKLLDEDQSITFREALEYKHSTRMELADRILDELTAAARQSDDTLAQAAADVLEAWDRTADTDSRGGVLFKAFYHEWRKQDHLFAESWIESKPRVTPSGLADKDSAVEALIAAAKEVKRRYGALDVPWGEVHRLRRDDVDLPANGGSGSLGIFRVTGYREAADGCFVAASGDSYVALTEFDNPVRAKALTVYGNASQPGSPHRIDQMELFSKKQLRDVWLTREEIEAHLEKKEIMY